MLEKNAPIGVFDSGLGGLTVAREIMRNLPNERIVYFGDTARVPYGSKSKRTIEHYARQIVRFLKTQKIKAIVVACNTATALAIDEIIKEAQLPVVGVVEPGARVAVDTTKKKRVGVIATHATTQMRAYTDAIQRIDPDITVIEQACPMLVPLVEEGWTHDDDITDAIIMRYLQTLLEADIDTLILGCTHYPLLRTTIRRLVGEEIVLVNPAYETALDLKKYLSAQALANENPPDANEPSPYRFYVSDDAERFTGFANAILPIDVKRAQIIDIEAY